jgi:uncharacterized protein (PEP-CTERM system associated)
MRGRSRGRSKKKNTVRGRIIWVGGGIALLGLSLASREAAAQLAGPSIGVPTVGPGGTGAAGAMGGGGGIATGIGGGLNGFSNAPGAFTVPFGAYGLPPAPATAPPPLATGPVEIPSVPPAWLLTPSIQLGEAFNDNVNLAPKGSRISDFITTITPGLTLAGQSARVTLNVTYDPQELIFARSSPNTVLQQRLNGTGRAELWLQTLYVEGAASISQAYARATGAVAPTTLTTNNNLETVYTETASPYVLQHLGSYADSESRYRFTSTSTSATNGGGGSGIAPEITHELRQTLLGGEFFDRLGWQGLADYTRLERGQATGDPFSGTTAKDELLRTDFKYPVYQSFSAVAGIGYERITDPTLTTQPKGVIWDVGVTYQPNQLVAATLTYGQRFARNDIEFNATYNLDPQLSLSAIYTQTIQTGQSLLAASQTPSGASTAATTGGTSTGGTSTGGAGIVGGGGATGTSPSFGLSSGAFLAKTGEVAATLTKERNTYSATLYETKISGNTVVSTNTASAATVTAERVFGGFLNWGHLLRPDLTANTGAGYYRTLFLDGTGRRDKVYTLSVGLTYNLSRTATATLSLSRSDQRSNITSDTLLDDIIMATIQKQF